MHIKLFDSCEGDAVLLTTQEKNILIDGGRISTYDEIKEEIKKMEKLDLVILTHYDDDHIYGLINLFRNSKELKKVEKIWANLEKQLRIESIYEVPGEKKGLTRSGVTACKLQKLIPDKIWHEEAIIEGMSLKLTETLIIDVLNPTKEIIENLSINFEEELKTKKLDREKLVQRSSKNDYKLEIGKLKNKKYNEDDSISNISSIVTLIKDDNKFYLFTGDCPTSHIEKGLRKLKYSEENKLKLELLKLPHHGSNRNFNPSLLDIIDCQNFLLLTDGSQHGHPTKETIVKILEKNKCKHTKFYTNYDSLNLMKQLDKRLFNNELENYSWENINVKEINL